MNYTVQYTDCRWKISGYFAVAVEFQNWQPKDFVQCQRWMAKTYGDSVNESVLLDLIDGARRSGIYPRNPQFWSNIAEASQHWCYRESHKEFGVHRLYLRGRQELNFFQLRFGG